MANNYTDFAYYFDVKEAEAEWLSQQVEAINALKNGLEQLMMDDFEEKEVRAVAVKDLEKIWNSLNLFIRERFSVSTDANADDLDQWDMTALTVGETSVAVTSNDEGMLTDSIICLLQAFVRKFRKKGFIAIHWSDSCDKYRHNEFGGGAVFITADFVKCWSSYDWVEKEAKEFAKNRHSRSPVKPRSKPKKVSLKPLEKLKREIEK